MQSNKSKEEHAVIISFQCGIEVMENVHALEKRIVRHLKNKNIGSLDGHELGMNADKGWIFLYGPNAGCLFKEIELLLKKEQFLKGGTALLRFGPPVHGVSEIELQVY